MNRLTALIVPIAVGLLAGCGSSSKSSNQTAPASPAPASSTPASTTPASSTPAAGGLQVTMQNLSFNPKTIQAKVGETVTFTNQDTAPHNVTPVSGPPFSASATLTNGQTFKLKLTKAGTISYYCSIHPFMKGTIVVAP
jgi:plastocyanin